MPTELKQAALAIRKWANDHGLLRLGSTSGGTQDSDEVSSAFAISDEAIGVLEKQRITAIGTNSRQNAIYVYTSRSIPKRNHNLLPRAFQNDFQIIYKQAKPISINVEGLDELQTSSPYVVHSGAYACGSSIGLGSVRMAGTLGCLVRDSQNRLLGLTNNHVTGGCNNTRLGMPITAPGIKDVAVGGYDPFTIDHHHMVLPMRQGEPGTVDHAENTDAALLLIASPSRVSSMQGDLYDTPRQCVDPEEDMIVEKVGRSTGHRIGKIETELTGPVPVFYKTVVFHNSEEHSQFIGTVNFELVFVIRGTGGPFALPGDSGSLVTTVLPDGTRAATGLVFAGIQPDISYMLPLRPVLDRFGVTMVSGHNV